MNKNKIKEIELLTEELSDILQAMKIDETLDLLPEAKNLVNELRKKAGELSKENIVKIFEEEIEI